MRFDVFAAFRGSGCQSAHYQSEPPHVGCYDESGGRLQMVALRMVAVCMVAVCKDLDSVWIWFYKHVTLQI
jgi:hypothetical protein